MVAVEMGGTLADKENISRRQFVASAISAAAISSLPAHPVFAEVAQAMPQAPAQLTDSPAWKDQGVENLAKSPHAKLRDIPVRAVTITGGFWSQRREINMTKSIPSMRDLL